MRERRRKFNQNTQRGLILGRASGVVVGIGLVFTLGLLYLSQSNAIALKGYSLSDLENRKAELQKEKERLEIEATRLQSIQEIQKTSGSNSSGLTPTKTINYLPTSSVAVK